MRRSGVPSRLETTHLSTSTSPARRVRTKQHQQSVNSPGAASMASRRSVGSMSHGTSQSYDPRYIATLKEQIHYLELECSVLKGKRKSVSGRKLAASHTDAGLDDSIAALSERCKALEMEHRLELDKRDHDRGKLLRELTDLRTELQHRQSELDAVRGRAEDMIENVSQDLEVEIQRLAGEIRDQAETEKRIRELEALVAKREAVQSEERRKWKSEEADLKFECDHLSVELNQAKTRIGELESSLGLSNKLLEEARNTDFEAERKKLLDRTDAAESVVEQLRGELAFCRNALHKSQETESTLREENQQLVETNGKLHAQVSKLRKEMAEMAAREDWLKKTREEALTKAATQAVQYDSMKKDLDLAKKLLGNEEDNNRKTLQEMASQQAKIQELTVSLNNLRDTYDLLEFKWNEASEMLSKLQAENVVVTSKNQYLEKELVEAKDDVLRADQARAYAEDQMTRLQEEVDISKDLHELNIGEFQNVLQTNMKMAQQFDLFLKRHHGGSDGENNNN